MSANCAGIVGAQLFRSDDLPCYNRGWSVIAALMSLTLTLVIVLLGWYHWLNSQMKKHSKIGVVAHAQAIDTPSGATQGMPKLYNY
jgi:hypothetical protein